MAHIEYRVGLAEVTKSAVAAILLTYVVRKCVSDDVLYFESSTVQFDLGFSDVEFYSALKTLREIGYLVTKNTKTGKKYIPECVLLHDDYRGAFQS